MKLSHLAHLLVIKYAADLLDPSEDNFEKESIIKDNIVDLYRKFMPEFDGALAQIKEVYDLPFLENLHTEFARLIAEIDGFNIVELNKKCIELMHKISEVRSKLNDFIKTNKDDPAFVAAFMRKRLASTIEKILEGLALGLKRQLEYIQGGSVDIQLPSAPVVEKRRRMEQTPQQQEMLVLKYGDLYGINSMVAWGYIKNRDMDLAFDLMTAFLGLQRASREYQKSEDYDVKDRRNVKKERLFLLSKVKKDLAERVEELLKKDEK